MLSSNIPLLIQLIVFMGLQPERWFEALQPAILRPFDPHIVGPSMCLHPWFLSGQDLSSPPFSHLNTHCPMFPVFLESTSFQCRANYGKLLLLAKWYPHCCLVTQTLITLVNSYANRFTLCPTPWGPNWLPLLRHFLPPGGWKFIVLLSPHFGISFPVIERFPSQACLIISSNLGITDSLNLPC